MRNAWSPVMRAARRAAPIVALSLVFVCASIAGFVIHLDTKPGRRLVVGAVNSLVSGLLVAELEIERIDAVSPTRLVVSRATLLDRLGKPVLVAEGLEARFGLYTILHGIFAGNDVRVAVPEVRVERFAFSLRRDPEQGGFTIETAFDATSPRAPGTPAQKVFVALPRIEVAAATVTTDQPGIEKTNARVLALTAGLDLSPVGLVLSLKSDDARVHELFSREVKGRLRSELRLPGTTRASLDAHVGRAPVSALLGWRGSELDLGVSSSGLEPDAMRELFAAWPLAVPLRASAQAKGEPKAMKARTEGELGAGRFSGSGSLALTPEIASTLAVHAQAIDLRAFDPSSPETALDFDATVTFRFRNGIEVDATATLAESRVAGYPVPPMVVQGAYAQGALRGTAKVLEPKLATDAEFEVSGDGRVTFSTKSSRLELDALARYGVQAKGRAALRTHGVLERGRLVATVDGTLDNPDAGAVRADHAVVHGRVEGPVSRLEELMVELAVEGEKLDAGGVKLARFRATSKGSGARQSVTLEDSSSDRGLAASAEVALRGAPVLSDVRLKARRGDDAVEVAAKRVVFETGGVTVRDVSLRAGEGTAKGSLAVQGRRRSADLTLTDLDLRAVLAALGLSATGVAGRLDGHVKLEEVGSERTGQATLRLRDGAFPPLTGITAELGAKFAGSDIQADVAFAMPGLHDGKLEARGSLERSVFDPRAVDELTGRVALTFADLELEKASGEWLAPAGIELGGRARGKVTLTRVEPKRLPTVAYEVATSGLVISRRSEAGEPPSEIRIDIDSVGELAKPDGSRLALQLSDARGPWITAAIEHSLGAEALARAGIAQWKRAILEAPLRADVKAFSRPLRMFSAAGVPAVDGSVAAAVGITGSVREPELDASASVTTTGGTAGEREGHRLDVVLKYSAKRESYTLEAHTAGERDRLELTSAGRFSWLGHGFGRDWSATGRGKLERFGLARLGRLIDVPVLGEASGAVVFDVEVGRAEANGDMKIDGLSIDRHVIGSGAGRLKMGDGRIEALLDIEHERSKLELLGDASFVWLEGGPELDPRRSGTLRATAREFDLASLRPFVRDAASRVTGRLNGRAELGWGPLGASGKRKTTLRANATVANGTASLAAGGGLIQKLEVKALADGDGPLRLGFSGAARSRKPNVKGTATLELDGPRLKRFDGKLETEAFPLLYDGVLMGRATTGARAPLQLAIVSADDGQTVDVHIPAVEVVLPKSSDKSLIPLDDDDSIAVSDAPLDPEEQRRALQQKSNTTLKIRLGKQVRIKRGTLDVPVTGAITVAPDGRLTGTITLPQGGVVPALGQIFRIRRGAVNFKNQEVEDGTLLIQAWTRVTDGTLVDLDVSGTVGEPVVGFSSDPPRSEDEIVAMILGIQTDSETSGANDENAQLGRTAMALAMNRLVEDSMLSGLQFGAGETGTGDAVSTVTMRVGSKVWFEGRTVKGSQTSVNQEERVSGVVDWRFAPSWSLRTQLGDVSGAEIRWSLRY